MIKILIGLLSICGIFSMKSQSPTIKVNKKPDIYLGNVRLRNKFEYDGKNVAVDVFPETGGQGGFVFKIGGNADVDQNTVRQFVKGYDLKGNEGIKKEQIDQVIKDFKKKAQNGGQSGSFQTEFRIAGDSKEAQNLLNNKLHKHLQNRLDEADASKGVATEKTFEIAKGRKLTIKSVVAMDNDISQKVRQISFSYSADLSAANLDKNTFTVKSLIALIADVDNAYIMEEENTLALYNSLFGAAGTGFFCSFQQFASESSTQQTVENPYLNDIDAEVGPRYDFKLANGKKLQIMISKKNMIRKDTYELTFVFFVSEAITVQKTVTAAEILALLSSLNANKDGKWDVSEEDVKSVAEDANNAEVGTYIFRLRITLMSEGATLTEFNSPDGTDISKMFKQQQEGLFGGEIIKGEKYEIKLQDLRPQLLTGKLSNGQSYSITVGKKQSNVVGSITEIIVSVSGVGSSNPVPTSEIIKIIKDGSKIDVSEEQAAAIATSINGSIQVTATIITNSLGKVYYPDIKANGPEVKFRYGDRWLSADEFEIFKKQNKQRFVADESGHVFYYYDTLGAKFGQHGQKAPTKKFEFNFSNLDAQLEALTKEAEKALLNQKEIGQKYFIGSKEVDQNELNKMFGKEFNGKGIRIGGNYVQYLNPGNINQKINLDFFQKGDGQNIKIDINKPKVVIKEFPKPKFVFSNGNIYFGEIGMNKEEYQKYLLTLDKETAEWLAKAVDMEAFESTKVWHILNGKRVSDEEFKAYLKAHPKDLLVEVVENIGTFYYYDNQRMDEATWLVFVNKNPHLGFSYIENKWVRIEKVQINQNNQGLINQDDQITVDDGFVIINGKKYTWEEFVVYRNKESKNWSEAKKLLYSMITEDKVINSRSRGFVGLNEVKDDDYQIYIKNNPNIPIYAVENYVVYYYFQGKKYTESEFDAFVSQSANKQNFIKKDGRWVLVVKTNISGDLKQEQDKLIIGQNTNVKKTLKEQLGEKAFKETVIKMQKNGAYYDETKGEFVGVSFKMDIGKLLCNGKPCGTYKQYLEWYNTYVLVMNEQLRVGFQLIEERDYGDYFKPYLVGDRRMTENEFNAWKASHKGVKIIQEQNFYRIKVFKVDGMEFTEEELRAYIQANPWSGIEIVGGGINRRVEADIEFRVGKVYISNKEVDWSYFEGFKNYWLKYGDEQVIQLLNKMTKQRLDESAKIYKVENNWFTKEEFEAWFKQGDHSTWTVNYHDGFYYYQKPEPFLIYGDKTFNTEAEWLAWAKSQTDYNYELIGKFVVRKPIVQANTVKVNIQTNVKDPFAKVVAKPTIIEYTDIKYLNFKFTSSMTKESLKSLYLSGILKIDSGVVDSEITESNYGSATQRITITRGNNVCVLRLAKSGSDYFFTQVDPSAEGCKVFLAYGDSNDWPTCEGASDYKSVQARINSFIQRVKDLKLFNSGVKMAGTSQISCESQINSLSTTPARVVLSYTIGFGIPNPKNPSSSVACEFSFVEINHNLSSIVNANKLSADCLSALTPRRLIV